MGCGRGTSGLPGDSAHSIAWVLTKPQVLALCPAWEGWGTERSMPVSWGFVGEGRPARRVSPAVWHTSTSKDGVGFGLVQTRGGASLWGQQWKRIVWTAQQCVFSLAGPG